MAKKGLLIFILAAVAAGGSAFALDMEGSFALPGRGEPEDDPSGGLEFLVGYNYSSEAPAGFTLGLGRLYTSWNFTEGQRRVVKSYGYYYYDEYEYYTVTEFTVGYAFNLIGSSLRLPIGIGYYMEDEWSEFIIEAGLQLRLANSFYISGTYRQYIDANMWWMFDYPGFTIGAGIIF